MTPFVRRTWVAAAVFFVAACTSAPPPTQFPQLTYSHHGRFALDVAEVDIVDAYRAPLSEPHVEHVMPVAPAAAARQWARDRLVATGTSSRRAVFTVLDGAVVETPLRRQSGVRGALTVDQSERYDGTLAVRLEVFDAGGRRLGVAEANARRSRSVPENITLAARDKVWFALTEALANDLNDELDRVIPQFLGAYLR